jgi:putative redox protein
MFSYVADDCLRSVNSQMTSRVGVLLLFEADGRHSAQPPFITPPAEYDVGEESEGCVNGGIEMGEMDRPTRMKATARRDVDGTFKHTVQVREHQITVDEPPEKGGDDLGPSPQELLAVSLASCTAITMEMYAARKGWEIGHVEVEVQYKGAERGCPTKFELVMRMPADLPEEQAERLRVIAAKCPVHRALDGEVMFEERVERVQLTA